MKNFIKGSLFVLVLLPLIEGLFNLYEQIIQLFCTKIAVKTYKLQSELPSEEPNQQTFAMGFEIPQESLGEDDCYEDE